MSWAERWAEAGAAALDAGITGGMDWKLVVGGCVAVTVGMELLARLIPLLCETEHKMPVLKGAHLDAFGYYDKLYIAINKAMTCVFIYHLAMVMWHHPRIGRSAASLSVANTLVALPCLYIVYDLPYTLFHRVLHHRSVYKYVHKHHHRQIVPTRGNYDAINVHPFEFLVGEYLHIFAVSVVPCHVSTIAVFVVLSGVLASLNHTRFCVRVPGLYDSKNHDVHHRLYDFNFGQYIMLWDQIFGYFREYTEPKMARAKAA